MLETLKNTAVGECRPEDEMTDRDRDRRRAEETEGQKDVAT